MVLAPRRTHASLTAAETPCCLLCTALMAPRCWSTTAGDAAQRTLSTSAPCSLRPRRCMLSSWTRGSMRKGTSSCRLRFHSCTPAPQQPELRSHEVTCQHRMLIHTTICGTASLHQSGPRSCTAAMASCGLVHTSAEQQVLHQHLCTALHCCALLMLPHCLHTSPLKLMVGSAKKQSGA